MRSSEVVARSEMVPIRMQAALEQLDQRCLLFSQFLLMFIILLAILMPLVAILDGSLIVCALSFDPDCLNSGAAVV